MVIYRSLNKKTFTLHFYNLTWGDLIGLIGQVEKDIKFQECHYYVGQSYFPADRIEKIFSNETTPPVVHKLTLYFKSEDSEKTLDLCLSKHESYAIIGGPNDEWINSFSAALKDYLMPFDNGLADCFFLFKKAEIFSFDWQNAIKLCLYGLLAIEFFISRNILSTVIFTLLVGANYYFSKNYPLPEKLAETRPLNNVLTKPILNFNPGQTAAAKTALMLNTFLYFTYLVVSVIIILVFILSGLAESAKILDGLKNWILQSGKS